MAEEHQRKRCGEGIGVAQVISLLRYSSQELPTCTARVLLKTVNRSDRQVMCAG